MKSFAFPRLYAAIAAIGAGVLVLGVGFAIDSLEEHRYEENHRAMVAESLGGVRARLEEAVNAHLMVIGGLEALVQSCPECPLPDFGRFAASLARGHADIRSLQLAPDAVVSQVWPLEGNEAVVGIDLRRLPGQSETVERTIREGRFVLAGPLRLKQGGVGLVARKPIFVPVPGETAGPGRFWGFATIVIDFEGFLAEGRWREVPDNLRVALRGSDGLGGTGPVFLGDETVFAEAPVIDRVVFPNGSWEVGAVPRVGWSAGRPDGGILRLAVIVLSGLAAVGAAFLARALAAEREARVALEEASRAKSCFFARMSHELRTPLNAINGFAYVMMQEMLGSMGNPRYREYAEDIHRSGTHLLELVNTILDIQKVEAGRFELQDEDLSVGAVFEEIFRILQMRADKAGVTLVRDIPDDLALLSADPRALRQMLLNLLTNAIKYTESGGEARVTAALRADGGMMIAVSDTGRGIPEEEIEKALTPFGQVQGGEVKEGTGLGLPLTKSLVELHGGGLDLSSATGVGTTVTLWFPPERVESVSDYVPAV